jgi:hypothetical protein
MNELPPSLLRHLVNVTNDNVTGATFALVLKPGADPDDPDGWGIGQVGEPLAQLTDDADPLVFLTDEDETTYLVEG